MPERKQGVSDKHLSAGDLALGRKSGELWDESATQKGTQGTREKRRRDIVSNLLTLALALLIVAGGFTFPTLMFPRIDRYRGETVLLGGEIGNMAITRVFAEPVSLYPWNIYQADRCRPLDSTERLLLQDNAVPDFLLDALRHRGMVIEENSEAFRLEILNQFSFLNGSDTNEQSCLVLVEIDIDANGSPDFNCAVDLDGNIISLLFTNNAYASVDPTTLLPPDIAGDEELAPDGAGDVDSDPGALGNADATEGVAGEPVESSAIEEPDSANAGIDPATDVDPTAGTEETPSEAGKQPTDREDTDAPNNGQQAGNISGALPGAEIQPPAATFEIIPVIEEDRQIWSFAFATTKEAEVHDQAVLFGAFSLLNASYDYRYGQPFESLIPGYPAQTENEGAHAEVTADDASSQLAPTVFATETFNLYIYNLPNGMRLILYVLPESSQCVGFSLLAL